MFDVKLHFKSQHYEVEEVFGSDYERETGCVMKIDTVIASAKDKRGTKGGLGILVVLT